MRFRQLFQKKIKVSTVVILLCVVSFFWVCYYAEPDNLPMSERGTYDYHINHNTATFIWMSVDWADGEFYYTDQINQYYIAGKVEQMGDNKYWFRCNDSQNQMIIPDQLITRYSNDEITLMIGEEIRQFTKSADYTMLIGTEKYQ